MAKSKNSFTSMSKKDKVDFYISLVVISLAGILILAFTFSDTTNEEIQDYNALLIENPMGIKSVVIDDTNFKPLSTPFKPKAPIAAPAKIGTLKFNQISSNRQELSAQNEVLSDNEVEGISAMEDDAESKMAHELEPNKVEDVDSLNANIGLSIQEEVVEETVGEMAKEDTTDSETTESCIIIVGAFKKESNKNKLLRSLKADGFVVFTTPYKGLTRIGIYHPCHSDSISETLLLLRKKYAKDAMILVKD